MHTEGQSNKLEISVIIPVYNDPEGLEKCLYALKNQTLSQVQFEVIVVNNGPAGSLRQNEEWSPNVTCCHEPLPGSYAARNKGAAMARGNVLAFTDADCIPEPGWLERALSCFSDTGCDMIGGSIDIFKTDMGSALAYIYEKSHLFKQKTNTERGVSVTANFFIKKEAFEEAGGFNAEIKSMGDIEFTGRCSGRGYKLVYCEHARVHHPARISVRDVLNRRRRIVCWKTIHGGMVSNGKRLKLARLGVIRAFFGFRNLIRKKPTSGKILDIFRLKLMIVVVTIYEFFVRLNIATGIIDPYEVRE